MNNEQRLPQEGLKYSSHNVLSIWLQPLDRYESRILTIRCNYAASRFVNSDRSLFQ